MTKINLKASVVSVLMAPIVLLTGCGKSDCDLKEDHLHKYVNGSFVRYLNDEHLENSGYAWTNDIVYVKHSDMDFYKYETKKDLLKIETNEEALRESSKDLYDYLQYEYKYTTVEVKVDDKGHTHTKSVTRKSWTDDPEHGRLTSRVRLHTYSYTNYKIDTTNKGKFKLVRGSKYYDIDSIINNMEEYPYVKIDFYSDEIAKFGYIKNGTIEYDDGTIDELENYKVYKKH